MDYISEFSEVYCLQGIGYISLQFTLYCKRTVKYNDKRRKSLYAVATASCTENIYTINTDSDLYTVYDTAYCIYCNRFILCIGLENISFPVIRKTCCHIIINYTF